MTTPHKISQWLSGTAPEAFELPALRAVVEKYPYFWPAGLLRLNSDDEELDYTTAAALRSLYVPAPLRVMAEINSSPHEPVVIDEEPMILADNEPAVEESPTPSAEPQPSTDASISHGLEHDPLEDAVATTIGAEEGGEPHNAAVVEEPQPVADKEQAFEEPLPRPFFTADYFSHQGVAVDTAMPDTKTLQAGDADEESDPDRGLMVMRSFTDWMTFFQRSAKAAQEEEESKRAVRAMWQKEKLAAALEEEEEEIPEEVFQMAVASIAPDGVVSESLAEILAAQGKWERAVEMYRKLATKEPSKSAYFARKIEALEARHADS